MKKLLFISILSFLTFGASAQVKLGLKLSPNLSWNRVDDPSDTLENKGVALRSGGGVFMDFEFSDNYAFHTGVTYTTKAAGLKSTPLDTSIRVSLQYLEIPVAIKLFTNEIGTDMRMYFNVGTSINMNLAAKVGEDGDKSYKNENGDAIEYTKHFNGLDFSAIIGTGVEMQMGGETWVFGGISYNRGLLNINNKKRGVQTDGFQMYNEYLSVDLGLKF